jgi:Peptidase inhibitor I78 family
VRIVLLTLGLAACATMEPEPPVAAPAEDSCGSARFADLVGQPRRDVLDEVARRGAPRRMRWIRPGDAVTMDYIAERLNVYFDAQDRVERLACG